MTPFTASTSGSSLTSRELLKIGEQLAALPRAPVDRLIVTRLAPGDRAVKVGRMLLMSAPFWEDLQLRLRRSPTADQDPDVRDFRIWGIRVETALAGSELERMILREITTMLDVALAPAL